MGSLAVKEENGIVCFFIMNEKDEDGQLLMMESDEARSLAKLVNEAADEAEAHVEAELQAMLDGK